MVYKFFVFLLSMFLFVNNAHSKNIDIFYSEKKTYHNYNGIINNTITHLTNQYKFNKNQSIKVFININKKNKKQPYSQISENECFVNINLINDNPIIFKNFQYDLEFLLVHELGHCYYGVEHIKKRKINFNINQQKDLNLESFIYQKKDSNKCRYCFQEFSFDPFIAYSELLSDIFAINYFIETKKQSYDLILDIYNYRNINFKKTNKNTNYISNIFIENYYFFKKNEVLTESEIQIKSQETLLYFINEHNK